MYNFIVYWFNYKHKSTVYPIYLELMDALTGFIAHEFFKAYPDHELSSIYNKYTGLFLNVGRTAFGDFIGDLTKFTDLFSQLLQVDKQQDNELEGNQDVEQITSKATTTRKTENSSKVA